MSMLRVSQQMSTPNVLNAKRQISSKIFSHGTHYMNVSKKHHVAVVPIARELYCKRSLSAVDTYECAPCESFSQNVCHHRYPLQTKAIYSIDCKSHIVIHSGKNGLLYCSLLNSAAWPQSGSSWINANRINPCRLFSSVVLKRILPERKSLCRKKSNASDATTMAAKQTQHATEVRSSDPWRQKKRNFLNLECASEPHPGVAVIRLNRPEALNALCEELCVELLDVLSAIDEDDSVHCSVLTGVGEKAFAAGADIKEMLKLTSSEATKRDFLANWGKIQFVRKPIIAAVNGYALGGGCELAMMCDIIIASTKARFGQPEVRIGTICGMGGSQRLPRAVGKSLAMDIILTGRQIDAQEALQAGLVSRVVPPEKLLKEALALASSIAARSLPTIVAAKECVNRAFESNLQDGLLFERRRFQGTFANEDRTEGMSAFVEKRDPAWLHK